MEVNIFRVGDKVCKKSGKPFKCGYKNCTIKAITINPYTNKKAVQILEDNSIVDMYQLVNLTNEDLNKLEKQAKELSDRIKDEKYKRSIRTIKENCVDFFNKYPYKIIVLGMFYREEKSPYQLLGRTFRDLNNDLITDYFPKEIMNNVIFEHYEENKELIEKLDKSIHLGDFVKETICEGQRSFIVIDRKMNITTTYPAF